MRDEGGFDIIPPVMRKSTFFSGAAALAAAVAFADPFGALPDAKHAWAVHDDNRPGVKKIVADGTKAPSDAIVLFDGTAESIAANWCDKNGEPTKWTVDGNGDLISVKGAGYIFTKRKFSSCQLHVEWASPKEVQGSGQGRGNSGVFLMGNYEIQVLDSYETDPDKDPNPNPNYCDGQAGAVYGQNPPAVNPCRAPGEFNTYDIVFHAPVFNPDGSVKFPADITVLFNGVLVQDHWKFDGPTGWRKRATYARTRSDTGLTFEEKMPLAFQDHGNPVHFRNVWIREIARPEENMTHGDWYADEVKVMETRRATADRLDAEFDAKWGDEKIGRRLVEAWRIVAYFATPARRERVAALESEFIAAAKDVGKKEMKDKLGVGSYDMSTWYDNLRALNLVGAENPVIQILRKD